MIHSGLVSITFRQLSPAEIVALVAEAGLDGIEWGGDVHAPHGDVVRAEEVRKLTENAGLVVAAYGSYYRVGHAETGPFDAVLASAKTLGAPYIRVWAGRQSPDDAGAAYWNRVVEDSRRIAEMAASESIPVVYEFHRNTLTETNETAQRLLAEVDHPDIKSYWQPPRGSSLAYNLAGIDAVEPWLVGLHVFSWHEESGERLPLVARDEQWREYLQRAAALNQEMFALIEFVQDDGIDNFRDDAATLKRWLAALAS